MKDLTRRQFLRFGAGLGAAASAAGLAACQGDGAGTSSNDAKSSDGTIELTYWYCWTDLIKENNEERIQEFNDTVGKEKGIHVTAESQGSYDDLNSKLKSAFVAGEAPDVCVMVINSTKVFADGGMIQPIDDVIAADDLNDFWPGLMDNCKVDGSLYGMPYLRSTPVLYYNKTLFQKAGLDATAAPATWDDVVKASDALAAAGAKGYGFYSYKWALEAFAFCNGGTLWGDGILGEKATFADQPAADMVRWFQDNVANHNFSFVAGSNASDTLDSNAANQQVGMWVSSTADLTHARKLAEQGGYEVGVGFIPKHVQNKVPTGGCNLVMCGNIDGERRAAAAELINFMTSKDAAVKNHLKTGYLLTRQSCADDDRIKEAYAEIPEYQVALDQLQYAVGDCMNSGFDEASKIYTDTVESVMNTTADPSSALQTAEDQASQILSQNA